MVLIMRLPLKFFYFIRHGETDWNRDKRIMGQMDIPLNETGVAQARSARNLLKELNIQHIYTSPLLRAYQTAQILNEEINQVITRDDSVNNIYYAYRQEDHS